MVLTVLAFFVGALLILPGLGMGLCVAILHGTSFFPEGVVRIWTAIALFGASLAAWALWRMMR